MILATLLLIILAYPLYRFGLQRTEHPDDARRYLPAFITFSILLLLTAVFALNDLLEVFAPRQLDVIESLDMLDATAQNMADSDDATILLVGTVGDLLNGVTVPRVPQTSFPLLLDDGEITVVLAEGILAISWPRTRGRYALTGGQRVVVLGTLQSAVPITGLDDGLGGQYIAANTIYAGTYDAYLNTLPRFAVIPGLTLILSLVAALLVLAAPVRYLRTLRREHNALPVP